MAAAGTVRKEKLFAGCRIRRTTGTEAAHIYVAQQNAVIFQKYAIDSGKIGMTLAAHRAGRKQRQVPVNFISSLIVVKQP